MVSKSVKSKRVFGLVKRIRSQIRNGEPKKDIILKEYVEESHIETINGPHTFYKINRLLFLLSIIGFKMDPLLSNILLEP